MPESHIYNVQPDNKSFDYSVIRLFDYSIIRLFGYSVIQLFDYSIIRLNQLITIVIIHEYSTT